MNFDLEAAFVFSFLKSEAAPLGQAFYGLLDSAMGCSLPNPVLSLTALYFGGTVKAAVVKLVSTLSSE